MQSSVHQPQAAARRSSGGGVAACPVRPRNLTVCVRAWLPALKPVRTTTQQPLVNGVIFRQLYDNVTSTYTYLLGCPETNDAVLIDPVLEQVERDLEVVDGMGVNLVFAINTHAHADHITGSGKLKALRSGVRSAIAAASGAAGDVKLQHGDVLSVGSLRLRCLATPGHTSGCMSFLLPAACGAPGMVFTGDALLIQGCGRTDFQQGNAGMLYDNIHTQLFSLPDETLVWVGHDYKGRTMTSIGEEKARNPRLTRARGEFIELMHNLNLAYPKQIHRALPANMQDGANFPYA